MTLALILEILIVIILIIASIIDIKHKEIEDYFSYIIAIIGIIIIFTLGESIINGIIFALTLFLLGYVLYALGLWGGGDAKLLAALGFYLSTYDWLGVAVYIMIMAFVGIIYNNLLSFYYLPQLLRKKCVDARIVAVTFVLLVISLFIQSALTFFAIILMFDLYYFKIFEKKIMQIKKRVSQLTEGDWLLTNIKGIPKRKVGLIKEDIDKLKKMKLKTVVIKDGFAFIPVMTLSLIILFLLRNYGYLNFETLFNIINMVI